MHLVILLATDHNIESIKGLDKKFLEVRWNRVLHLIKKIYAEISDERVLDVAMGKWSLIKTMFPELIVVGIDRIKPNSEPDEFYLVNLKEGLPFNDSEFSFAFAGEILEHIGNVSAKLLLEEIFRVLRNGGYLLLTTPNGYRNRFKHLLKSPEIAAHEEELGYAWIYKNLVRTGFKIITSNGIQPIFIPWKVTTKFASLRFPPILSSQLVFLAKK